MNLQGNIQEADFGRKMYKMERRHFRTLDRIWMNDIFIWPDKGINLNLGESVRHRAIAEVLCSIPEDDYKKLKETFRKGYGWFIFYFYFLSALFLCLCQLIYIVF